MNSACSEPGTTGRPGAKDEKWGGCYGWTMRPAVLALLILAAGCGGGLPGEEGVGCTEIFIFGLNVAVVSATTGAPLCDATVTISDGSYQETLTVFPSSMAHSGPI